VEHGRIGEQIRLRVGREEGASEESPCLQECHQLLFYEWAAEDARIHSAPPWAQAPTSDSRCSHRRRGHATSSSCFLPLLHEPHPHALFPHSEFHPKPSRRWWWSPSRNASRKPYCLPIVECPRRGPRPFSEAPKYRMKSALVLFLASVLWFWHEVGGAVVQAESAKVHAIANSAKK
jgi:hypothetical protein